MEQRKVYKWIRRRNIFENITMFADLTNRVPEGAKNSIKISLKMKNPIHTNGYHFTTNIYK